MRWVTRGGLARLLRRRRPSPLRVELGTTNARALRRTSSPTSRSTFSRGGTVSSIWRPRVYARGTTIPKKPFPGYDGIRKTMELYDSNEMRRYAPEDSYDDSLIREIDASGFIDRLYQGS